MHFDWSKSVFQATKMMVGCLHVVRIYSSWKKLMYTYMLCISSFSLLRKKITLFIKEIKHVLCAFIYSQVKRLAKFVRILEQVKTFDCISGFHWSALEFSQTFTLVFTTLRRHWEHVLFLKWYEIYWCYSCLE